MFPDLHPIQRVVQAPAHLAQVPPDLTVLRCHHPLPSHGPDPHNLPHWLQAGSVPCSGTLFVAGENLITFIFGLIC